MSIVHLPAKNIIADREQKFHDHRKLFFLTTGHRNLSCRRPQGAASNRPTAAADGTRGFHRPRQANKKGRRRPAFFRIRAKLLCQ
jgi:hypothetical protein